MKSMELVINLENQKHSILIASNKIKFLIQLVHLVLIKHKTNEQKCIPKSRRTRHTKILTKRTNSKFDNKYIGENTTAN